MAPVLSRGLAVADSSPHLRLVLRAFAAEHRIRSPDTLAAAVLVPARIGGHIRRPRGPPPGIKVMWRATATLAGMCLGFQLAMDHQQ